MSFNRTRKIAFNLFVICLLVGGAVYVCSRFVHLGNVEYTDNAQVRRPRPTLPTPRPGARPPRWASPPRRTI